MMGAVTEWGRPFFVAGNLVVAVQTAAKVMRVMVGWTLNSVARFQAPDATRD